MFMGEYNHTIDAKGRLIIPSRFRELLGEEFVLTRGLDGCLSIYPVSYTHLDVYKRQVQPGFGGQKYMDECTEKIQELRELIDEEELDVDIQVDGGINDDTLETVMRAGANLMVAGSWVFKMCIRDSPGAGCKLYACSGSCKSEKR